MVRISSQGPGLQGWGGFLYTGSPILASSDITPTQTPEPGLQVWLGLPQMASLGLKQNSRINRKQLYILGFFIGKERYGPPHVPFLSPTSQNQIKPSLKLDISEIRRLRQKACKSQVPLGWLGDTRQQNLPFCHPTFPVPTLTHLPLAEPGHKPARVGGKAAGVISKKNCPLEPPSGLTPCPLCSLRDHRLSPTLPLIPSGASLTCCWSSPGPLLTLQQTAHFLPFP